VRSSKMLLRALGVERAVLEDVRWVDAGSRDAALVVRVRALHDERRRCGKCGRRCSRYDRGDGLRTWRSLDFGVQRTFIEAEAPRVRCREHGVVVQRVPWARVSSGFTRAFEDQVAWLAVRTDKTTLASLLRVAWRSVGAILERVAKSMRATFDPFAEVTRIGIDTLSPAPRLTVATSGNPLGNWVEQAQDDEGKREAGIGAEARSAGAS
jgi:transposase